MAWNKKLPQWDSYKLTPARTHSRKICRLCHEPIRHREYYLNGGTGCKAHV